MLNYVLAKYPCNGQLHCVAVELQQLYSFKCLLNYACLTYVRSLCTGKEYRKFQNFEIPKIYF